MKQSVAILWMVYLLSGCAELGIRSSVSTEKVAAIRTVAVASTLGKQFHGKLTGTTVFNNKQYDADVSNWNVDGAAIDVATSELKKNNGWSVKPLYGSFTQSEQVLSAARAVGADTVVVIQASKYDNEPHIPAGYGYSKRSFMGLSKECIYSLFIVEAYTVKSSKRMGWQWGFPSFSGVPCYGASRGIPFKEDWSEYSEAERSGLKDAVLESVRTNVLTGIRALKLMQ